MRYSLRNKSKIQGKLGKEFLDKIVKILDKHFEGPVKLSDEMFSDIPYPIIEVKENGEEYIFAVTNQKFDVMNLAYCKKVKDEKSIPKNS